MLSRVAVGSSPIIILGGFGVRGFSFSTTALIYIGMGTGLGRLDLSDPGCSEEA